MMPATNDKRRGSKRARGRRRSTSTPGELAEFREIFSLVDKDKGGTITPEELRELMNIVGIATSQQEIDLLVGEADRNGDGAIGFDEFVAIVSRKVDAGYTNDEVKHAFSIFQQEDDEPGHVKFDALVEGILKYSDDKMGRQQVVGLVSQLEKEKDGRIKYAEFVDLMML